MGDINCNLSQECGRSPPDSNARHLLNLYQLFSLKQIIKEPTRVTLTTVVKNLSDANDMIREWSSLFSAIIEKHAPVREMRLSDRNSPWITSELKSLMISRDRLKKAAVKHKSPTMMCSYKAIRNRVNGLNIKLKNSILHTRLVSVKVI